MFGEVGNGLEAKTLHPSERVNEGLSIKSSQFNRLDNLGSGKDPNEGAKPKNRHHVKRNGSSKKKEVKTKNIGHYMIGKTIGEGTFGKVKLGTHNLTGEKVAVKILEKHKIVEDVDVVRVTREIKILKLARHPNIIQLYEIIETPKKLYLITEYITGGELFDYIVKNHRLSEERACEFYQQIISGIEYLHELGIVHRDMKPENLLIDHDGSIKLVDFGLSNIYKPNQKLTTACGSPCYAAPEMIAGEAYHGSRADIWSCGIILFAMVCGYLPFEDPDTNVLYNKILDGKYQTPSWLSDECRDLISKILNIDPDERYTVEQIKTHKWYSSKHSPVISNQGLIIGKNKIPLEDSIVKMLRQYGFKREEAEVCLNANKHN
jgi:5'-AMP-activated protein kinase catalytic alpha subunit